MSTNIVRIGKKKIWSLAYMDDVVLIAKTNGSERHVEKIRELFGQKEREKQKAQNFRKGRKEIERVEERMKKVRYRYGSNLKYWGNGKSKKNQKENILI